MDMNCQKIVAVVIGLYLMACKYNCINNDYQNFDKIKISLENKGYFFIHLFNDSVFYFLLFLIVLF